jgi:hypothetical protein
MPARLLTEVPQRIRLEALDPDGGARRSDLLFHVPPSQLKPWMLTAFLNRGGGGNPVIRAFAKGVGCRIAYAEDEPTELKDIPVVWGVLRQSDRILAQAKAQQLYFFYIDHAYFNRGHGRSYRITRNGYEAGAVRACPPDRIADLDVELLPWRKSGREIIVCPPTEYFMQAHGCPDWLDTTLANLRRVTDRPIVIRLKPQPGEEVVPLPKALDTAHALVTHSSNVAIEAACLGTPVFVAPASAAAPVGLTDVSRIESPVYPDREPWLAHLAYNQFSFDEISDGRAWRMLLEFADRHLDRSADPAVRPRSRCCGIRGPARDAAAHRIAECNEGRRYCWQVRRTEGRACLQCRSELSRRAGLPADFGSVGRGSGMAGAAVSGWL